MENIQVVLSFEQLLKCKDSMITIHHSYKPQNLDKYQSLGPFTIINPQQVIVLENYGEIHDITIVDVQMTQINCTLCVTNKGTIHNCKLESSSITKSIDIGGLVYHNEGLINLCSVNKCLLSGSNQVGGIVCVSQGILTNCTVNNSQIISDNISGGIAAMTSNCSILCCIIDKIVVIEGKNLSSGISCSAMRTQIQKCGVCTSSVLSAGIIGNSNNDNTIIDCYINSRLCIKAAINLMKHNDVIESCYILNESDGDKQGIDEVDNSIINDLFGELYQELHIHVVDHSIKEIKHSIQEYKRCQNECATQIQHINTEMDKLDTLLENKINDKLEFNLTEKLEAFFTSRIHTKLQDELEDTNTKLTRSMNNNLDIVNKRINLIENNFTQKLEKSIEKPNIPSKELLNYQQQKTKKDVSPTLYPTHLSYLLPVLMGFLLLFRHFKIG